MADPNFSNSPEALAAQRQKDLDALVTSNADQLKAQGYIFMGQVAKPPTPTAALAEALLKPVTFDLLANEFQQAGVPADAALLLAENWMTAGTATLGNFREKIAAWAQTPVGCELRGVKSVTAEDLRTGNYNMGALMAGKLSITK